MRSTLLDAFRESSSATALSIGVNLLVLSSSVATTAVEAAEGKSREITVRLLAQEGLAIALASTVLQTQLVVLASVIQPKKGCVALENNDGGYKITTPSGAKKDEVDVDFYFDAKCKDPFAEAAMTATLDGKKFNGVYTLKGDVTYRDRKGIKVADLKIDEQAALSNNSTTVTGLGLFTPKNKGPQANLGLSCNLDSLVCYGGVAQAFPAVKQSLGSVSPLQLALPEQGVTFKGQSSVLGSAPSGKLEIVQVGEDKLALSKNAKTIGSTSAEGSAAAFSLFPPTPTGWTVTDKDSGAVFKLDVVNDVKRNSVATVSSKSGQVYAKIKVDQSGTGTISYFDGPNVPVVSWVLGG